jgi:hypothetical protein
MNKVETLHMHCLHFRFVPGRCTVCTPVQHKNSFWLGFAIIRPFLWGYLRPIIVSLRPIIVFIIGRNWPHNCGEEKV